MSAHRQDSTSESITSESITSESITSESITSESITRESITSEVAPADLGVDPTENRLIPPSTAHVIRLPQQLPALPLGDEATVASLPFNSYQATYDVVVCTYMAILHGSNDETADIRTCLAVNALMMDDGNSLRQVRQAGIGAKRLRYHPKEAARCLAETESKCRAGNFDSLRTNLCGSVFEGRVPAGGRCVLDEACVEGVCVGGRWVGKESKYGVCGPKPSAGVPCTSDAICNQGVESLECISGLCQPRPTRSGEVCGPYCRGSDLVCDTAVDPHVCRQLGKLGDTCRVGTYSCAGNLSCESTADGERCVRQAPRITEGGRCDPSMVDSSKECERKLVCAPIKGGDRCLARVGPGVSCQHDKQCFKRMVLELVYLNTTPTTPGRCGELPAGGERCGRPSVMRKRRCRLPFTCHPSRQVCVRELDPGDPCPIDYCGGLHRRVVCVRGTCRRRLSVGARCRPVVVDGWRKNTTPCVVGSECKKGRCRGDL